MADTHVELGSVVKAAVSAAMTKVAENQNNSLKQPEVAAAAKTVVAAITPVVEKEATAIVTNMTNQEPLLQSRNMWTFGLGLVAIVASMGGYVFTADDQTQAVTAVTSLIDSGGKVVAAALMLWGMWNRIFVAGKKPLGS